MKKRTYEETHPWLTFSLDLNRFTHQMWISLGEVSSKCAHIGGAPLAPEISQYIHQLFLAKGALATTAIEGNTLSEEEVRDHLEGKLKLPPSRQYLANEIDNIVKACNMWIEAIEQKQARFWTVERFETMNKQVLEGLALDEGVIPGMIRRHNVTVGRYRCAPAVDCHYLLERLCDWLNEFPVPEENKTAFIIIKAIFAHLYFVWIHPFGDGNGRTARLIELYILLSAGLPQPTTHLLSNHYNRTRNDYYRHLDHAVRSEEHMVSFFQYAIQGFKDGIREQIDIIRQTQWKVSWINYIHDIFRKKQSPADRRRRDLVLCLSEHTSAIPISDLLSLSGDVAVAYANRTAKTLSRDLNILEKMNLIVRKNKKIRAQNELILSFLPWSNPEVRNQEYKKHIQKDKEETKDNGTQHTLFD